MNLTIIRFVQEEGYGSDYYFGYEPYDRKDWLEAQKAKDRDASLLKMVNKIVNNDPEINKIDGEYIIEEEILDNVIEKAKVELGKEKAIKQAEAEKNKEKNRKLAQASYDIFAWDKEESENLEPK